jgi:type II secretory ATPase GspE/PulE/Tfp pilus assembly ATPase PilB-like protein
MELAFDLATSGIRVMATVHAASGIHTVQRLLEWDLDPFIVATTLRGVLCMRLLQRLCPHCRVEVTRDDGDALWPDVIFGRRLPPSGWTVNPKGCAQCKDTGTAGQFPIGELLQLGGVSVQALRSPEGVASLGAGMRTLEDHAFDALVEGATHVAAVRSSQIGTSLQLVTGAIDDDPFLAEQSEVTP